MIMNVLRPIAIPTNDLAKPPTQNGVNSMATLEDFTLKMGASVTDNITGFKGFVTARVQYISGCNQYLVQPTVDHDGKHVDALYFDEDRLTANGVEGLEHTVNQRGGPQDSPPIR